MINVFSHRTKSRSGSQKRLKPTSRNQHSPRLEWLEDRLVLSPAPSVNLDQFANGTPPPTGAIWTNGNLNKNNSTYHEGSVVPFRLALEGLTPGATDSIHLVYDFTDMGHEAYDFLASYNATESPDILGPGGGAVDSTIRGARQRSGC